MTEAETLALVASERRSSIGFDEAQWLTKQRETALNYYKGDMKDFAAPEGRSQAVSTDVADAIETIKPDLIEIFTSEDVAAFMPRGEEDEDAAEQETDYINHVFFNENDGFLTLFNAIDDALKLKVGVFKWWSEEYEESETFEGKPEEEAVAAVMQHGDALSEAKRDENGLWSYKITRKGKKPCVKAVAPEDFTVSADTVSLKDTPYCAHRSRHRAFELIQMGFDRKKVKNLGTYGVTSDEEIERARDTAGEGDTAVAPTGERRLCEIVEHYLRQESGKYLRVVTNADETILFEQEEINSNRFAAITPFIVPHRFYGESIADRLIEIQRINTSITRMVLDQGYFALNGRNQVDMTKVNEWTIPDLLNNQPNMPIRTNGQNAITPMVSSGLGFDGFAALEFFATKGEQRTGIVRNAQGLNPDTLHDTAQGALALMSAAQKRVRLIARIFAETGIKDMFLGLHALIRETASGPLKARLRNKWVEIDPTSWGSRSDMTIEIGVGASGKEAQAAMLQEALAAMREVVAMQGGVNGPFITPSNAYNLLKRYLERGVGFKSADPYLTDPEEAPPQEPQPDPAMMELQAKTELQQQQLEFQKQKASADIELQQMKAQAQVELEMMRSEAKLEAERERSAAMLEFEREKAAQQAQLAREKAEFEAQLARDKATTEAELALAQAASHEHIEMSRNRPGGDLDK